MYRLRVGGVRVSTRSPAIDQVELILYTCNMPVTPFKLACIGEIWREAKSS